MCWRGIAISRLAEVKVIDLGPVDLDFEVLTQSLALRLYKSKYIILLFWQLIIIFNFLRDATYLYRDDDSLITRLITITNKIFVL